MTPSLSSRLNCNVCSLNQALRAPGSVCSFTIKDFSQFHVVKHILWNVQGIEWKVKVIFHCQLPECILLVTELTWDVFYLIGDENFECMFKSKPQTEKNYMALNCFFVLFFHSFLKCLYKRCIQGCAYWKFKVILCVFSSWKVSRSSCFYMFENLNGT